MSCLGRDLLAAATMNIALTSHSIGIVLSLHMLLFVVCGKWLCPFDSTASMVP